MFTTLEKNSHNVLKDINGSVHIGDNYSPPDETGFRKKVLASLNDKSTISTYIDDLAKFINGKTEVTTIGLETKLSTAGYSQYLARALDTKESFVKALTKSQYSIAYQKIIYAAIDEAMSLFSYLIRPLIDAGKPTTEVMSAISELIFEKLYRDLADVAEHDFSKCTIEGLVFYLTGNCFLKWAKNADL